MNTRRKLVIAIGAGALAPSIALAPRTLLAQQSRKLWRIGHLTALLPEAYTPRLNAFKSGMTALGYADGRDYVVEVRSSGGDLARLPALAAELVALNVDLVVTAGTPSVVAASRATRTIPIVMTTSGDPVGNGVAASLRRPGGNVTGMTSLSSELISKRVDLLRQVAPQMQRTSLLYNPADPNDGLILPRFEADCRTLKLRPIPAPARTADEIANAFRQLVRDKAQGVVVTATSAYSQARGTIIELAATHRLPVAYSRTDYVEAGGLFSYAPDNLDLNRRAAAYADKIFKGAKPADLPIQQPLIFDLVINMKTAKALGIKFSQGILIQATRVIE